MTRLTHGVFLELRGRAEQITRRSWVSLPFTLVIFGSRVLDEKPRNKSGGDNKEKPSNLLGYSPFGDSLVWAVISILAHSSRLPWPRLSLVTPPV